MRAKRADLRRIDACSTLFVSIGNVRTRLLSLWTRWIADFLTCVSIVAIIWQGLNSEMSDALGFLVVSMVGQ